MKVLITNKRGMIGLCAVLWTKDQRFVAKVKKQYFVGTVTRVGKNKLHLVFDDGVEGDVDIPVKDMRRIDSQEKYPNALTRQEAQALVDERKSITYTGNSWAISDVHGCYDQFKALLKKIGFSKKDTLYVLGDVIDHGPDSKKIIDFLMKHENVKSMPGNHEDLMMRATTRKPLEKLWLKRGGVQTLESFGVETLADIPKKYMDWLKHLPLHLVHGNIIMSHAGVNMQHKSPLRETKRNREFTLWNRKVKNKHKTIRVVHGHSPKKLSQIKAAANSNLVCIDGGCSKGGKLVAFNLDTNDIVSVPGHKVEHE